MAFIAGAGLTNIDLLYQGMERIPGKGEELYCKDFSLQLGGGIPATLINLGRLGIETKIATNLGNDMFSAFAKENFYKNSVTPYNLYKGNKIPVNITSAIILPDDRTFFTYGKSEFEADGNMLEEFYNIAKGAKICFMHLGGFLPVYKKLKEEGTILVLDTGWDDKMSFDKYDEYLTVADYYTPNRKEALKITGKASPKDAAYELKKYFDKVIVKLDADGCIGIDGDNFFFIPSVKDFKCVDSTGAGDAFLAGFAYGLFYDYKLKDCIKFGNITGGKSVTGVGALSAFLTEEELKTYKKEYSKNNI